MALAALAGGVGAGVGEIAALRGATGIAGFGQGVARGVIGSALTQGIALATGLQHRFDWAGVAAAGLSGGVFGAVNPALARAGVGRFVGTALSNTAAAIAGAGAQSLLTGSDFGDTLMRSLPQVIGETIGNQLGDTIEAQGAGGSGSGGDPDSGGGGGGASGDRSSPGDTGGFTISVARGYQPAPATIDNGTTASAEAGAMAASGAADGAADGDAIVVVARRDTRDAIHFIDSEGRYSDVHAFAQAAGYDNSQESAEFRSQALIDQSLGNFLSAASFAADVFPIVAIPKASFQLAKGYDPVTGRPASSVGSGIVLAANLFGIGLLSKGGIDAAAEYVGASSAANGARLGPQLLAEEVANGHALAKHLAGGEFAPLGIRTKAQFQNFVEGIVSDPATPTRYASDGTKYFLDESTRTIVISGSRGEATAFRPDYGVGWENYLNSQVPRNARLPGYDPVPGGR